MRVTKGKRLLGVVSALVLMISLLPQTSRPVKAADYGLWVGDEKADLSNVWSNKENTASYDSTTKTLTLNNFVYEGEGYSNAAIYYSWGDPLTIEVKGTNSITCTASDYCNGIFFQNASSGKISFTGDGTLNIKTGDCQGNNFGIHSFRRDISITNCTINITTGTSKEGDTFGIYFYENDFILNSCKVTVNVGNAAGYSYGINTSKFINVTVAKGSEIVAKAGKAPNSYGIEAGRGQMDVDIEKGGKLIASGETQAIFADKVKNAEKGTGWTDSKGKTGKTTIETSNSGQKLMFKRIQFPELQNKLAAPTITPAAGTYNSAQDVTISTTTEGAEIYYTVDGTNPTTKSNKYTGPIKLAESKTIKAIAVKEYYEDSNVTTAKYTINKAPAPVPDPEKPDPDDPSAPPEEGVSYPVLDPTADFDHAFNLSTNKVIMIDTQKAEVSLPAGTKATVKSLNTKVAKVKYTKRTGKITITAAEPGNATINVKVGKTTVPINVIVKTGLEFPESLPVKYKVKSTIETNLAKKNIKVKPEDPKVVSAKYNKSKGEIILEGKAKGSTRVKVTYGCITKYINVNADATTAKLKLSKTNLIFKKLGKTVKVGITATPKKSITGEEPIVKCDNESVATVTYDSRKNKVVVTSVSTGTAKVTVTVGKEEKELQVEVR